QSLWSTVAASNATADAAARFAEGMAPSTINDGVRVIMARIRNTILDLSGMLVTTGAANAYSLTTNEVFSPLVDGHTVAFRMNAANTGASTINVDSTGAKPLRSRAGVDLLNAELRTGVVYVATYVAATTEWLIAGYLGALDLPGMLTTAGLTV